MPMTKLVTWVCDNCGKRLEDPKGHTWKVPIGWVQITIKKGTNDIIQPEEIFVVCNNNCGETSFKKRAMHRVKGLLTG